jgi:hypothetical protein
MTKQVKPDPIEIRLNAIIRLLSDSLIANKKSTKSEIFKSLNEIGFGPTEIGKMFGKTRTDVNSFFSQKKTIKKKSSKGDKDD